VIEKNRYTDLTFDPNERQVLRTLASRVAELAARPSENEKRRLWHRHNALQETRPLVFCDPENGWLEIIPPDSLFCTHPLARNWENRLRMEVFWGEKMQDDRVIESFFDIPHSYTDTGWGMQETIIGGGHGSAFTWDAPLKEFKQIDRLHFPQIIIDHEQTERILAIGHDLLGDLLQVRQKTSWWWSLGMTRTLVNLRGMSQFMYDMADNPVGLHRLMSFLRDGTQAMLDYLEASQLLGLNNDGTYVGSGGFGWSDELPQSDFTDQTRLKDLWGFAESQETVGISPRMFKEFVFDYQLPILERFGLNCYGCCEPLDKRWPVISNIPRLRRVSISPWSSLETMAELLQNRYIFSMKPHPGVLALETMDEERIRQDLRKALKIVRNCPVEIIMKDNETIGNDPSRVIRWVKIAKEESSNL
jgi:hypothetical protein